MKHFIAYSSDGTIIHVDTFQYANNHPTRAGHGGFDDEPEFDPRDPTTQHPGARHCREVGLKTDPSAAWSSYECECPAEGGVCSCAFDRRVDCFCEAPGGGRPNGGGVVLVGKPVLSILLDGQEISDRQQIDAPSGSKLTLQVRAKPGGRPTTPPGAARKLDAFPDGARFQVMHDPSRAQILEQEEEIQFVGGAAERTIQITVPSQGVIGSCIVVPVLRKHGSAVRLFVRGWA
jgi:hypothetical protein